MSDLKRNELIELIINYNKKQDEHKQMLTMPTSYKYEFIRAQVDKNIEAERLKTVDKMINFNNGLSASISTKNKDIVKLKFPNRLNNLDYQAKAVGEAQAHRGQSFICSNNNPELILKELANAKANNEIDYFSTILDFVLMNVPPQAEQMELTAEQRNFYKSAEQLSEDFKKEFRIDILEKSVYELEETKAGAEGFLLALHSGAEKYLTKDLVLGMTEKDKINNTDIMNNSLQYWPELKQ